MQFSRARWYDPKIGRFISEDPIGFGGGDVNLYGYVGSSPIGLTDPSGHLPIYSLPKGKDVADALDRGVDALTNLIGDPFVGTPPGGWVPQRLSETLKGPIDLLRVGFGTGCAMNSPDMPAYRKFELYAQDYVRAGTLFVTMASPFSGRFGGAPGKHGFDPPASIANGSRRAPIEVGYKVGDKTIPLNSPTEIYGRGYSGHALDRMQGRGIPPSAVENTIQHGQRAAGNYPGTTHYYDPINGLTVITNTQTGRVITTW
jgi:hypothetical protein